MKPIELNSDFIESRRAKKKLLSPHEEIILKIIYNFQSNGKVFFGSDHWLADKRNVTERTIQTLLRSLEKKGYIDRSGKYQGKRMIRCLKPTEEYFHYFRKKSTGTSGSFLPEVPEENFGYNTKGNPKENSFSKPVEKLDSRYNKRVL